MSKNVIDLVKKLPPSQRKLYLSHKQGKIWDRPPSEAEQKIAELLDLCKDLRQANFAIIDHMQDLHERVKMLETAMATIKLRD